MWTTNVNDGTNYGFGSRWKEFNTELQEEIT